MKIVSTGFIASGLTLPYLWFVFPMIINGKYMIFIGEILTILVEAIVYKITIPLEKYKLLVIAIVLNVVSYILGKAILTLVLNS
jgi:hypothetical protein